MSWEIRFTDKARKQIAKMDSDKRDSLIQIISELEIEGNKLRMPWSKSLQEGLFELRDKLFRLRAYYIFAGKKIIIVLLCGDKDSQSKDIQAARKIMRSFL